MKQIKMAKTKDRWCFSMLHGYNKDNTQHFTKFGVSAIKENNQLQSTDTWGSKWSRELDQDRDNYTIDGGRCTNELTTLKL